MFYVVGFFLLWTVVFKTAFEVHGHLSSSDGGDHLRLEPRVIGGAEVWNRCRPPYNSMVALQFQANTGTFTFCSAVMLTDTYLVTSGYCAFQMSIFGDITITAVIGERDLHMKDLSEQRIRIDSFRIHRQYNDTTLDNNIALLKLAARATTSSCIQPALKFQEDSRVCADLDQSCLVAGWGSYVESNRPSNSRLPRYASVTVLGESVTSLLSSIQRRRYQPVGSLYAEAINPNVKVCNFDWGGFVSCLRNGKYVLRGLIGEHNCHSNSDQPFMVTDVPYFQSWIDRCTNDWNRC